MKERHACARMKLCCFFLLFKMFVYFQSKLFTKSLTEFSFSDYTVDCPNIFQIEFAILFLSKNAAIGSLYRLFKGNNATLAKISSRSLMFASTPATLRHQHLLCGCTKVTLIIYK